MIFLVFGMISVMVFDIGIGNHAENMFYGWTGNTPIPITLDTMKDVVVAISDSHEDDKDVDPLKNVAIAKCGEISQEYQEMSDVVTNIVDLIRNNPAHVPKHTMLYNRESHNKGDVKSLPMK